MPFSDQKENNSGPDRLFFDSFRISNSGCFENSEIQGVRTSHTVSMSNLWKHTTKEVETPD